jgi:hypothetical protein
VNYVNALFGWLWVRRAFIATMLASASLFFVWFFPFGDLSNVVTTVVARGTGNQIYLTFDTMDLHLIPTPAVSAGGVSVETAFPPLEAKWAKITPSLFSMIFNLRTILKAQKGDPEASRAMMGNLGFSVDAEDILGADVDLSFGPGKKGERGERSRVALAIDDLNLSKVQDWADLSVKIQGRADLETDMQIALDFQDQPEGEIALNVKKFNLPASTVMVPMGEGANMPVSLPHLTLENVILKGRLVGGNLIIEEGVFGNSRDPVFGRIKGQMGLRFQPSGGSVIPILGNYNLTVDITATKAVEKDLGIAFLLFDSAKTPTNNGSRYLFRASGSGMGSVPQITRLSSF